ncbi:glycogen debranching enzyme [Stachybotrys elegans]|uniref:Glycogen debranching enzyme n=1 Tax=Stachybotrys elegans TaxID=80388 RepID=A0A8K0SJA9_9HYPO|nr:glycogen debranching enzyme [Stachybotrys elegans]
MKPSQALAALLSQCIPSSLGAEFIQRPGPSQQGCHENTATRFTLPDPPYVNYFYSDCHSSSQVVVTSPLPSSDLALIQPRLLIAWPSGNSGIVSLFEPQSGVNGSLAISLRNSSSGNYLDPVYEPSGSSAPVVGVTGLVYFNASARLTVPILGSIRTIRDYVEGSGILVPSIQNAIQFSESEDGGVILSRLWLDSETTTTLSFTPSSSDSSAHANNRTIVLDAGEYTFRASFNYPQLEQLRPENILTKEAQYLFDEAPDQALALEFLSYTNKVLAGAWRFLTYFGRDSMISLLLLEPILATGNGSITEAGISALLERINRTDGTVAHEETIGDYATYLSLQQGVNSTAPQYDYKMIDTDYFLPIVLADYFIKNDVGKDRAAEILSRRPIENPANSKLTYGQLALLNAEKIMEATAAFAAPGGQVKENMIRLKPNQPVGEWRDSNAGLGGGRIPYNVNTALVPAGLRAVAALARAGFFPDHPGWAEEADKFAQVWEDETLRFFRVHVPREEARSLLDDYVSSNDLPFPSRSGDVQDDVTFYGLALDGQDEQSVVRVMNTDDCFRLFLINTTNQAQLSAFINQTADHLLQPFPLGLATDVGPFVANPAYGTAPFYASTFTNRDYHGTVVWSWQLAMMAAGLERQLGRCTAADGDAPEFCGDEALHDKVLAAYNRLWDVIEQNSPQLSGEVWSWRYEGGRFVPVPLGEYSPTESNIRQLWSLTFLAVRRNEGLRHQLRTTTW